MSCTDCCENIEAKIKRLRHFHLFVSGEALWEHQDDLTLAYIRIQKRFGQKRGTIILNWFPNEHIYKLLKACRDAKRKSYSPYSKFRVGAALLCEDGTIITGCNVENASYGLSICAERTAIVKAVSEGQKKFKAIAISSDMKSSFIVPCGACRQFLVEFGVDWDVYMTKPDLSYDKMKTGDLLPKCFVPDSLEEERISKTA